TVTARVRPWLNFWRTCVSPPLAAAAPGRAAVDRVSGLVGLVVSFCSVMRFLSLLRSGPSTGAVRAIAAPARRSARNPLNELTGRIVARHGHVDSLLSAKHAAQSGGIAQTLDRQAGCLEFGQSVAVGLARHHQQPRPMP